jgi:hypothetical protein
MPAVVGIPVIQASASGVALGGNFYVVDSGSGYGVPLPLKVYDPVANSWSLKAVDPVLRGVSATGVINNKIYVAEGWGGQYGSDANVPLTALEIYDPATDSWTAGASSLVARGLSATAVIGGKLYIAGGTAGGAGGYVAYANLEIYDALTDSWSMGAPLPNLLTAAGGAAFGGKFYVFGGEVGPNSNNQQITGSVQIYDPVLNTWITGTSMPTPRQLMVVGVINGKIYIASGNNSSGNTDSSVVVYDPITDSWSAAADEPNPRSYPAAAVVDGKLFVAGGNDPSSGTATAEVFTPDLYSAQIQQPINPDGSSVFNVRRGVVPVKFTLTDNGNATCALPPATIALTRTAGGTTGAIDESIYSGSADTGSNFRIDSCQYVYNLSASALGVGTYRVDIKINNQVVGSATFQLK